MSLKVWLPLNGTLENKGLLNDNFIINTTPTYVANGKIGQAMALGSISMSATSMQDIFKNNTFSLCFWLYVNADTGDTSKRAMFFGNNSPRRYSLFQYPSCNDLHWSWANDTSNNISNVYYNAFPSYEWTHCTVTYDSQKLTIYLNGIQAYQVNITYSPVSLNYTTVLFSNCANDGRYLNDYRIYDHCLSAAEVHEISQGLVLHYKLDGGINGNENFILASHKITSGGDASGITRTYMTDDSLKVVAASGNSNWCSIGFAKSSNDNVGAKLAVGDIYTISCDVKVEEGTTLPTVFINSGNSYKRLQGTIIQNQWIRAYYTSTWADPGTGYGNISLHLGFSGLVGTYYFKNFKLEKSSFPTVWSPAPADGGVNLTQIQDSSGYGHNGTINGTLTLSSDTPRYSNCTVFNGSNARINVPNLMPAELTISFWMKRGANTGTRQFMYTAWNGITCELQTNGTPTFAVNRSSYPTITGTPITTDSGWVHYCATFDTINGSKLYQNGILKSSNNNVTPIVYNIITNYIGYYNTYYNGAMSDFRIYCTALSAADVKQLYEVGAKVDNKQNLHIYEAIEMQPTIKLTKQGQMKAGEFQEDIATRFYKTDKIIETNNLIEL